MGEKMKQRISYALGAFGHDTYYYAISTFFIAFVTSQMFAGDKNEDAMIALVTSLVVIIRLVEIIFDPIIGGFIDNTHTRWGKFKPWLVVGGIMSSLMIMLMFSRFFGLASSVNKGLFTVVFIISFIILDAFYSFKDISFWGMIPALSATNSERETLGTFARFGSAIGAQGATILAVPITIMFTSGGKTQGARGFFAFGVMVAIVQGVTALITAWGTKEQKSDIRQTGQKTMPIDIFKALIKNDQLMWLSLSYILFAIAYVATTATLILNFTFIIGHATLYSITGIVGFIGSIILVPCFPLLARKFGRRKVLTGAIVSMIIGYILFVAGSSVITTILGLIFLTAPYQLVFLSVLMTITDSVEYGQWKNGVRNEAVTLAMRPLLDKIAGAFSNGIYGFVAIAAGMTGSKYVAGKSYGIGTFKLYAYIVPAVLMIISLTIYLTKVKLTEKRHAEIVAELEDKLGNNK
ncbi:glycoside-pentoside-hexuronide (GPH):cation symporter [Lactococcus nasutitermitis]|uniref:Glycoside-pentoside-hexuronide (GPH):cation symporter n=1 Tax=Lactococcus nasutitermitis TaxID=1652957 RepID=A0ABV9JAW2_9LACT|nr:glycoside-pentoside-hexuronide (GPH):cation symporter [Lactococcus nasutitermitis]